MYMLKVALQMLMFYHSSILIENEDIMSRESFI